MRPVSQHSLGKTTLTIVRPLLQVWREEIDAYIAAHDLNFREDATNARLAATRNRMRHKIIPFLEKEFGREIRKSIWRAAIIATEEDALLDSMLPRDLRARLKTDSLGKQPVALQRRIIRQWLRASNVGDVSFDLSERIRSLFDSASRPAKVNLPRNRYARRRAGELFIE